MGVLGVVVEEPSRSDLDVEEPPRSNSGEDTLRGYPHFGGVLQPAGTDAEFQRPEFGFGGGDDVGCAGGVAPGTGVGSDHNRPGAVLEARLGGAAAAVGEVDPVGVFIDGRKGLCGVGVAAQFRG